MKRLILLCAFGIGIQAGVAWSKTETATILGAGNEFLSAGAYAIRVGDYEEGIRLTELGLARYSPSLEDRAAALHNLRAAHAAMGSWYSS